ncbi:MAG: hypothetical protein V4492_00810 [Chlamydiota bacterium]
MGFTVRSQPIRAFDNQNFFQLASIQSASLGLSVIIIGKQLATQYGPGTAICSIAIGNLILWLIGISIISMPEGARASAIDNMKTYFGKTGGWIAALIFMASILNWFAYQINFSLSSINTLSTLNFHLTKTLGVRIGAALGLIAALLSIGGIRLIRQITMIGLPLLLAYHFYALSISTISSTTITWGISLPAVLTAILILLPGVINYPTFFRHSRSKAHSFLALTLLTILISFFQISTIWIDCAPVQGLNFYTLSLPLFIIFTLTTCNLLNIYLVSACWETIAPKFGGAKGYAIIGLFGTLTYTFVQITTPVQLFQNLTNAYIANFGIVLLLTYLMRLLVRNKISPSIKNINLAAWAFGSLTATFYEIQHFLSGLPSLIAGVNACILFFLCVLFFEETASAIRSKFKRVTFDPR